MGTDKKTGTTWFGINKTNGNFAFLTNYRQFSDTQTCIPGCMFTAPEEDLGTMSKLMRKWYKPNDPPAGGLKSRGNLIMDYIKMTNPEE